MESILYKSNPWWEEDYNFLGFTRDIYLEQLNQYLNNKDILFLTGLRRVGKTSILKSFISTLIQKNGVAPKEIFYISLDLYA